MARRTRQEAEQTRENILKAALDIIYEKGYARSTFVDIARQISLTKGAIYWHFKSKPDMFLALGRQMEDRIGSKIHGVFDKLPTLSELKQMLFETILFISEDEQVRKYYAIVFYRMEWTEDLLPIKTFFENQDQKMAEWVGEILHHAMANDEILERKNIPVLTRAILGLVDGMLSYCLYGSGKGAENTREVVQTGLDMFFMGMQMKDERL